MNVLTEKGQTELAQEIEDRVNQQVNPKGFFSDAETASDGGYCFLEIPAKYTRSGNPECVYFDDCWFAKGEGE